MRGSVHDCFGLAKLSQHRIYTITNTSHIDYQWWKAKNHWHSIDAHVHEGARSMLPTFFPIKVANTLIIYRNDHIAFELPDLQNQKSLMLCWCSISEWCRERESSSFAYNASQYHIYEWSQPIAMQITNDARTKIVDAPLMLILPCAYPQHAII